MPQDSPAEPGPAGGRCEDLLALFLAAAPVAVALLDRELRFVAWSEAYRAQFGIAEPDLEGLAIDAVLPDLAPVWRRRHRRALAGESSAREEDRCRRPDGSTMWHRWQVTPIRGADGAVVGIATFSEDITARKEAEEALRASEERLRLAAEAAGVGFYEKDLRTGAIACGENFLEMLGLTAETAPRTEAEWDALLRPEAPHFPDPAGARRISRVFHPEVRGERRIMRSVAQVFEEGEGAEAVPARLVGVLIDETGSRRLHEELGRAQRLETVGQMGGMIAHDFNNLLTVIQANLELAALRAEDPALRRLLARATEAAEMGAGFNKRLIALAGGKMHRPEPLRIDAHIAQTWSILERVLADRVELRFHPGASGCVARIDRAELDGALINLVVNARDAQPEGGEILVRTEEVRLPEDTADPGARDGTFLRISVSDDGVGMSPEVARRALEPFFTTKGPGRGSGLGLTSVAMTAERAGGFIEVASEGEGRGTTVSILLPLAPRDAAPEPDAEEDMPLGDGELVLVVEDDALVREAVLQRLEALGYAVIEAANADVALEALAAGEPVDLVFSDVLMPGSMSGRELAKIVAQDHPGIAMLLTSGYASRAEGASEADDGAETPLLPKPYTIRALAREVARALTRARRTE